MWRGVPAIPAACTHNNLLHWPTPALCSIDPPGCTDVDDALSVRWLDSGSAAGGGSSRGPGGARQLVEVGVHIADVSYFVRQVGGFNCEQQA